jgi:hypothetical protein
LDTSHGPVNWKKMIKEKYFFGDLIHTGESCLTKDISSSLWNSMDLLCLTTLSNSTRLSLANCVINAVSVIGLWALKMLVFYY